MKSEKVQGIVRVTPVAFASTVTSEIFKQKAITVFTRATQFLSWPFLFFLFHLFFRVRITGKEHFKKIRRPFIIAANHIAWYDSFLFRLALGFWTPHLPLRFMAVRKFDWAILNILRIVGIVDFVYYLFGVFTVMPGAGIENNLKTARDIIQAGGNVIMYPEGGIVRNGTLGEFKKGTAVLTLQTRAPIILVAFRRERGARFRRRLFVNIGEPIRIPTRAAPDEITALLRHTIARLASISLFE